MSGYLVDFLVNNEKRAQYTYTEYNNSIADDSHSSSTQPHVIHLNDEAALRRQQN